MNEMCVLGSERSLGKGIERLVKQILQYINKYVPKDQINIGLVKKCKTTNIYAVNSAIGNIQKA